MPGIRTLLFVPMSFANARQYAPATQRNREPILSVLQQVLPTNRFQGKTVLEISSGTGEHSIFFAPRLSYLNWLPSDPNPLARDSIAAWQTAYPPENCYPPIDLDASKNPWPIEQEPLPELLQQTNFDRSGLAVIVNINMIHIAPWAACEGLMAGAERLLPTGGILYLYGPFFQQTVSTAPSNLAFDQSLKARDQRWGIRHLETVVDLARSHQLIHQRTITMPANNLSVVFQKR